jgi:hypothetical protein
MCFTICYKYPLMGIYSKVDNANFDTGYKKKKPFDLIIKGFGFRSEDGS